MMPFQPAGSLLTVRQCVTFLVLLLLAAVLYLPSLTGPLVHDDYLHFGRETVLAWESWDDPAIGETLQRYPTRFIAMGSFGVQHLLFGENTAAGKAINLALHLANGILLLLVLRRLLRLTPEVPANRQAWLAIAVAGLWLLHPLQVSTVAYTVQRLTQLSAFFTLLAFLPWLAWLQRGRSLRDGWLAALGLALAIPAYFSKETGALVPLLLLLCLPLAGWRPTWPRTPATRALWALAAAAVTLLLWEYLPGQWQSKVASSYRIRDFDLWERLMTEARVMFFYLSEILWPVQERMTLHLDDIAVSRGLWQPWTTLPAILGITALAVAGAWLLARRRLAGFGILFFLAGHSMESTVIGLEIAYEHRNYLPMAGLLLAIGSWVTSWSRPRVAAGLAVVASLFAGAELGQRAAVWGDGFTLHASAVTHHPQSARSHYSLAHEWLRLAAEAPGFDHQAAMLALHHFRRAAALKPTGYSALHLLAQNMHPSSPEYDAVWNELYARARLACSEWRDIVNTLQTMTDCVVNDPDCRLPPDRVEKLLTLTLGTRCPVPRFEQRMLGLLLATTQVRATGRIEEGLALSRSLATPACPKCRVSYFRNLVVAGHLAEARAWYPNVTGQGRLAASEAASLARALSLLEARERTAGEER